MRSTAFIREGIENKEKTKLIASAIAAGTSQYGMQTFDQSLYKLLQADLITYEEALRQASNPDELKLRVSGIQSTADMAQEAMESALPDELVAADPQAPDSPFEFSRR
jgi:twitching motility protein PilT